MKKYLKYFTGVIIIAIACLIVFKIMDSIEFNNRLESVTAYENSPEGIEKF